MGAEIAAITAASSAIKSAANAWLDWVHWLNGYDKSREPVWQQGMNGEDTEDPWHPCPLWQDIDLMQRTVDLCNDIANGRITNHEFYKALYNMNVFDIQLLGPEYAWLKDDSHPTYTATASWYSH